MPAKSQFSNYSCLLLMPSFYGLLTWTISVCIYWMRLIEWDANTDTGIILFVATTAAFALASVLFFPFFVKLQHTRIFPSSRTGSVYAMPDIRPWLIALHAVGFLGIMLFVLHFSSEAGGISSYINTLVSSAYLLRNQTMESSSIGTQLSYFGWLGAILTLSEFLNGRLDKRWLILVLLQFLFNLLWVDRTRPTTLLFHGWIIYLLASRNLNFARLSRYMAGLGIMFIFLFIFLGMLSGKAYGNTLQEQFARGVGHVTHYLTGGFAYINDEFNYDRENNGLFKTIYPVFKAQAYLSPGTAPPSQVLEFKSVPLATNVGTFLEPFHYDGGLLYMVVGILIYTFGLNYAGYMFMRADSRFSVIGLSTLCWVSFMAFFTPKIASTETWLFLIIAYFGLAYLDHRVPARVPMGHHTASIRSKMTPALDQKSRDDSR